MLVGKDKITLDVKLGFLLTPLKPAIEQEIHAQLDKLFGAGLTADAVSAAPVCAGVATAANASGSGNGPSRRRRSRP